MIAEYERYHGIVVRELVVRSSEPLSIGVSDDFGRVNSFCINGLIGLHIKHCSKRLPPWRFTFNEENVSEIEGLKRKHPSAWVALVCGIDGVVCLSAAEFDEVSTPDEAGAVRFVRVDRDRNTMYRVFGNAGKLGGAKARGVAAVLLDVAARMAVNGCRDKVGA